MEPRPPIDCDVSGISVVDAIAVEALARLALEARRIGTSIRLRNASPELVELLAFTGLADVLPASPAEMVVCEPGAGDPGAGASGVEMDG